MRANYICLTRQSPLGLFSRQIYVTPPFAGACEHASIGKGGELEWVFRVPKMHRISKFDAKVNKVSGRRLILFPEDHFKEDVLGNVLTENAASGSMSLSFRICC